MPYTILNVGRPKAGKTTMTKKILNGYVKDGRKKDFCIYDVNNEYAEFHDEPFLTYEDWIESIKDVKNKIILVEEATIFFSTRSSDKILKELLVRRRHTNNVIILNFHSINDIPKYIFNLTNYVILFKTNDDFQSVKAKCSIPKFLRMFEDVQKSDDLHINKTFNLYG